MFPRLTRNALLISVCTVGLLCSQLGCRLNNSGSVTTEKKEYGTAFAGLPFTTTQESYWPNDPDRVFAPDDWGYVKNTIEASWDRAGKLIATEFTRLAHSTKTEIFLETIELYTKNGIKIEHLEVGFEKPNPNANMPDYARMTLQGYAVDVMCNVKFSFGNDKEPAIIPCDTPLRYVKMKPGFQFNVTISQIFSSLIRAPGAGQMMDFVSGLLGSAAFKSWGGIQGTMRYISGEERRFPGPSGKYSMLEHHLAKEVFGKLCTVALKRAGKPDSTIAQECAIVVSPDGKLMVDAVANLYNNMKLVSCEPRRKNGVQVRENIHNIYDLYFVAPPKEALNVDLTYPGQQVFVFKDNGQEYRKVGDYGIIENVEATKCGTLAAGERCAQLRFGRSSITGANAGHDKECSDMTNSHIVAFRKDDSFKKQ